MKILYFITGLGIGGAERITLDLAEKMIEAGHEVTVVYLAGKNCYEKSNSLCTRIVGLNMKKNPWGIVAAICKTRKLLREIRPDVVHGNMFHANMLIRIVRIFCRIPRVISTEHSKNVGNRMRMKFYRLTDYWTDVNTNVSEEATAYFIRQKAFSVSKSLTVYNGVDLIRFCKNDYCRNPVRQRYGIDQNDFLFLHIGRMTEAKDQINLLNAFSLLAKKEKNVRLLFVGDGEKREELKLYAERLHLSAKITWAGLQINTEIYYNAADAFVLSSAWEGFGIVLAEAMACELPVVSTDAGGCREVVGNPEYVVPIKEPKALYRVMERIFRMNTVERMALGKENRRLAMRFDLTHIQNRWLEIYKG